MGTPTLATRSTIVHDGSMKRTTLALMFAATVGLLGCGSDSETPETTAPDTSTPGGLANPASVFCVDQGGTLEIVSEADGEVGYCTLPDGTRVEEWEYYRSQQPTATSTP